MDLPIVHEDNHLLAVVKPPGLPVQRDRTGDPSLNDRVRADLKERYAKPGNVFATAVHRLDRPVSGLVLVARTSKAARRLAAAFREERVEKLYLAVVEGRPPAEAGELAGWLVKDPARNTSRLVGEGTPGARAAALEYEVLGRFGARALLVVRPRTGRSHQIRVQLAAAGMPIAGDLRYGSKTPLGPLIGLHAAGLAVPHPTRGERVTLVAPPPEEWGKIFGERLVRAARRALTSFASVEREGSGNSVR